MEFHFPCPKFSQKIVQFVWDKLSPGCWVGVNGSFAPSPIWKDYPSDHKVCTTATQAHCGIIQTGVIKKQCKWMVILKEFPYKYCNQLIFSPQR